MYMFLIRHFVVDKHIVGVDVEQEVLVLFA